MFDKILMAYAVFLLLVYGLYFIARIYRQLNCYCNGYFRYFLDCKTYNVYRICKSCGKKIYVGNFDIEHSPIDGSVFKCRTKNQFDVDCAYKCLDGKIEEWSKQYHHLEYCFYSLDTSVKN